MKELRPLFYKYPGNTASNEDDQYYYGAEQFFLHEDSVEEGQVVKLYDTEGKMVEAVKRFGTRRCGGKELPAYINVTVYVEVESG